MKVVFYKGESKFTIANVSIPNIQQLHDLLDESEINSLSIDDLRYYNFRITSTRGLMEDERNVEDEELAREIEEGINMTLETVN